MAALTAQSEEDLCDALRARVAKQKALVRQLKKDGGEFGPAVVELTALKKQLAEMAGSDVGQTFDVSFWFFPFPFPTGEAARAGVGIGLAVPEYGLRRMDSSFSLRSFLLSYRLELGCVSVSYPISSLRLLFSNSLGAGEKKSKRDAVTGRRRKESLVRLLLSRLLVFLSPSRPPLPELYFFP